LPRPPSVPPSFPTRRSSDLDRVDHLGGVVLLVLGLADEEGEDDRDQGDDRSQQEGRLRSRRTRLGDRAARGLPGVQGGGVDRDEDRKSTRLNSSHVSISYAV